MEIDHFRVTVRARNFDRTTTFYGETLALPRVASEENDGIVGHLYQAGPGQILVLGRSDEGRGLDEAFEYRGPQHKLEISLMVDSAQKVYDDIIFRQKNIPGGLTTGASGETVFQTYDPDGVKILFREHAD